MRSDRSVACWGAQGGGAATPPAGSFDSVSAGAGHTCGVRSNGSVACWGSNADGRATPPAGSFVSVSAGAIHTCGVRSNGSVACWGFNGNGEATPPTGSFVSVSAGRGHTCGVKSNGSVACWGSDESGQATPPAGSFDDHGNDFDTATRIAIRETVAIELETYKNRDMLVFRARPGTEYVFTLSFQWYEVRSYPAVITMDIHDTGGRVLARLGDYDFSLMGSRNKIRWQAATGGDYYIVLGNENANGGFVLTVTAR